jgi:hypothetical protein
MNFSYVEPFFSENKLSSASSIVHGYYGQIDSQDIQQCCFNYNVYIASNKMSFHGGVGGLCQGIIPTFT